MSPQDGDAPDDHPASRKCSTDDLAAVALSHRLISPPNEILFLDNTQDARSMRSTIQRHTAHHAAAQRREAKLQSSRERTPLNLEWQRRSCSKTSVSSPSYASTLDTLAQSTTDITEPARPNQSSTDVEASDAGGDRRSNSWKAYRVDAVTPVESLEPPASWAVLQHIGADETGRRALDAYELAVRAQSLSRQNPQHWGAREESLEQVNLVLGVLRQRLDSEFEGYSDQTIQTVLVLFVYASKFQTPDEATSHRTALDRMISLRGGLDSFDHNLVLARQLERFISGDDVQQILRVTSGPDSRS